MHTRWWDEKNWFHVTQICFVLQEIFRNSMWSDVSWSIERRREILQRRPIGRPSVAAFFARTWYCEMSVRFLVTVSFDGSIYIFLKVGIYASFNRTAQFPLLTRKQMNSNSSIMPTSAIWCCHLCNNPWTIFFFRNRKWTSSWEIVAKKIILNFLLK